MADSPNINRFSDRRISGCHQLLEFFGVQNLGLLQMQVQHPEYGEPFIGNTNAGEVPGVGAFGKPSQG